jgi:hypothetical protein
MKQTRRSIAMAAALGLFIMHSFAGGAAPSSAQSAKVQTQNAGEFPLDDLGKVKDLKKKFKLSYADTRKIKSIIEVENERLVAVKKNLVLSNDEKQAAMLELEERARWEISVIVSDAVLKSGNHSSYAGTDTDWINYGAGGVAREYGHQVGGIK